ncbi:DUF87 domain-containing protein [Microbacterium sp. LMC-P-041]|uniref:helicase HerA domain-containing protein n=1 Tax=Microbacterium sp. LMC-P-041 TaxID=3040293 RepID=UPI00255481CA|nr:DUF87 domain-containing protein [Microbacterium sp. LMC-P-041]
MTALSIGTPLDSGLGTVTLDPRRFNRHTFWCGQSGSGKTYALGVVLEQLLLETELPMLILDPNADFVRLQSTRPSAAPHHAERIARTPTSGCSARGASRASRCACATSICRRHPRQPCCG